MSRRCNFLPKKWGSRIFRKWIGLSDFKVYSNQNRKGSEISVRNSRYGFLYANYNNFLHCKIALEKILIYQAYNCLTSSFAKTWILILLRSFSALITKTIDIMYKGINDYVSDNNRLRKKYYKFRYELWVDVHYAID